MSIKSYKDLLIWQKAHKAAIHIFLLYKSVRKISATYELWKQCLRAAFSVPANIVEGFHSHRGKNFVSKLEIARGESAETGYWVLVLNEIGEMNKKDYDSLSLIYQELIFMITSLIKKSY